MKRLLLTIALLLVASPAFAACPSPLTGLDAARNVQNFGVTVDGSGNCYGNVALVDGTNAANKATVNASGQLYVTIPSGAAPDLTTINASINSDVPDVTGPLNAGAAVATKMLVGGGQYLASLPTMTNTQQISHLMDINGRLLTGTRTFVSSGSQQNNLAIGTNTQLTVPAGTVCAQITHEVASVRRTSDTTSASAANGTLIPAGAQYQDCGPLAAYKYTAVSGSPTVTVEYFK
jgi:hypothetical protein